MRNILFGLPKLTEKMDFSVQDLRNQTPDKEQKQFNPDDPKYKNMSDYEKNVEFISYLLDVQMRYELLTAEELAT